MIFSRFRNARHAEREERRLRAARRVPHLLGARHRLHDLFGELDRGLVQQKVRRPARHLPLDGLDDGRMRVTEEHRARAQKVVEVPPSGHVPQVCAAALLDDEFQPGPAAVTAQDPARQHLVGASQKIGLITHR
jgi:hypothetical protein